jgi:hypothetical protein
MESFSLIFVERDKWVIRETREGWPLVTVEIEANGDSKSTNDRGPSLVGSLDSSCWYNRFLSGLGCSSQPSTKHYFPHHTLFHFISTHCPATWAGWSAESPVSVSLRVASLPPFVYVYSKTILSFPSIPSLKHNSFMA